MSPAAPPWRRLIELLGRPHARPTVAAALLTMAAACSSPEATYSFELKGPRNVFAGATTVSLFQNNKMVATTPVTAGGGFNLEIGNVDPIDNVEPVIFSIKAFDAANLLVAYGEAPGVEILPQDNKLKIFVQKPGTIVPLDDLEVKLKDHIAFASETVSASTTNYHVTAAVFGFGTTTGDVPSGGLFVYNPLLLQTEKLADLTPVRSGIARLETPALAHGDNQLLLFGGVGTDGVLAEQLDEIIILRTGLTAFSVAAQAKISLPAGFARTGGVLGSTGSENRPRRLVFGGRDANGALLNSVAAIDESPGTVTFVSNHPPMASTREGHTVTVDPSPSDAKKSDWGRVLIYGGTAPGSGAPVAELLNPMLPAWVPMAASAPAGATLQAHPLTARHGHVAVILPSKSAKGSMQVLMIGGYDDAGVVRGDSVLCVPAEAFCEDGGLRLAVPRARFAAFVVKDDLVVVGGVDAAGAPIGTAEVFNATSRAVIGTLPAVPRIGPTATTLGNLSTVIIGGEGADKAPLGAVESYQPYRNE
jgi:hypothetical protein